MDGVKAEVHYDRSSDTLEVIYEKARGSWMPLERDSRVNILLAEDDDRVLGFMIEHFSQFGGTPVEVEWPEPKAARRRPRASEVQPAGGRPARDRKAV